MQLPVSITGVVQRHNGRGRTLGYPTANLTYDGTLPDGVFFAYTTIGEEEFPSLAFIGTADTFNDFNRRLEVFILDFDRDIYDQQITVELITFIRENRKFESVDELIKQMQWDEQDARVFFSLDIVQ
jgi:riboflavin kinase/FMN adenylyltransferase